MASGAGKDRFIEVFLSGLDVSRKLGEKCPKFPRDVNILIGMVEESLSLSSQYRIYFHPRLYRANTFIGTIEAFDSEAHIYYDRDRNKCWRRFIVVKELCHLLYANQGEHHLASTPDQVEQLLNKIMAGLTNLDITKDYVASTEQCALLMAVEALLPHSERSNVAKVLAGGGTELDVAANYLIPEVMVKFYLGPAYRDMMDRIYKLAGQ
jgi:hypothetical protein